MTCNAMCNAVTHTITNGEPNGERSTVQIQNQIQNQMFCSCGWPVDKSNSKKPSPRRIATFGIGAMK